MRVGDDMYFDPAQVAVGFARAAQVRGATLLPHTAATAVLIERGRVTGVDTSRGQIHAPIVVDAAGAWTRQVAEACGVRIPLVPTAQQLFVTEPLPGVCADLPMVRIMDAAVYVRPCDSGFLWGVYEEDPRFFDMSGLDEKFQIKDMALDPNVLWRYAEDVKPQLPVLLNAKIREHRGGIPTMTGDGQHIVGPTPAVRGFFFASGCNVAGLSILPALGEALAGWIVDGRPPIDLTSPTPARFGTASWPGEQLLIMVHRIGEPVPSACGGGPAGRVQRHRCRRIRASCSRVRSRPRPIASRTRVAGSVPDPHAPRRDGARPGLRERRADRSPPHRSRVSGRWCGWIAGHDRTLPSTLSELGVACDGHAYAGVRPAIRGYSGLGQLLSLGHGRSA